MPNEKRTIHIVSLFITIIKFKPMKSSNNRRSFMKRAGAFLGALGLGAAGVKAANTPAKAEKKTFDPVDIEQDMPLFSGSVVYGNLLFVAGKGAHFDGDISAHTDHVLNEIQKELEKHGASMEKVLKVNVYLADLNDYQAMNKVYRGRFGKNPPVRTTVATYGGVPGDSLVEIDCIAALD